MYSSKSLFCLISAAVTGAKPLIDFSTNSFILSSFRIIESVSLKIKSFKLFSDSVNFSLTFVYKLFNLSVSPLNSSSEINSSCNSAN